jgi:redox-sensitive bicupin YhaK (pirin superfamily)
MERGVARVLLAGDVIDDGDMHLRRALPHHEQVSVGPFVFLDHYRHRSLRGIGDRPHPHAGIEVVSYLLEGGVEHRDSMGSRDRLGPGDAQFIRAGRGMLHAEQPMSGRHGLQLWLKLPAHLQDVEASYTSLRAGQLPVWTEAGCRCVIVAGEVNGLQGPMELSGGAVMASLDLQAQSSASLGCTAAEAGLYVLGGEAEIGGVLLGPGALGVLAKGSRIRITAKGEVPLQALLIGGDPVQGPVLFSGPFVMDSPERLAQARRDYATGRMGRLDGVPV